MRRRGLLAAVGVVLAARAEAQSPARLAWIESGTQSAAVDRLASMRAGLKENGLSEKDYVFDVFYADSDYQRFPGLVQQALARNPALLLVQTIASVRAAQQGTKTIPIVFMATNDPVGAGLIDSLARPGGNTTGVATLGDQVVPKLVDMMHSALPAVRRVAVLVNPGNPTNRPIFESIRAAAGTVGIEAIAVEVAQPEAIDGAIASAAKAEAVIVALDAMLVQIGGRIASLCSDRRMALLGATRELADAGGLLSYGPSLDSLIRRSAYFVKRILAGARPQDLPAEQPTKFELTINLKTAKAIGVTFPPNVLALADDVIE
ncbi:MAG: ABC transporter substrate-binding protein [Enhydrobacter sp.]